ncbi:uncharacterized protein F4812DRAFT_409941 [Daldinia caldariorum]|uniref:uncharacterized protein n=1 Tax=Daldinia caldariorum TaxID=326644 RepID=UPI002007EE72|nr:uncharacterized protein F4812DRAFT_409941 [Daldinia caldariorum]KAI1472707.1 hypothetical protein F4812DRAFT_409941 [Daldinia caldariorum]
MAAERPSMPPLGHIIIGNRDQVLLAYFDGTQFVIASRLIIPNWMPASILFKPPNILYAANKLSSDTNMLRLGYRDMGGDSSAEPDGNRPRFDEISFGANGIGSYGGRHLAFNTDRTRMVECSHITGEIDVWDISREDNAPRLMKTLWALGNADPTRAQLPGPREAILDPIGRYFVIANAGNRTLSLLDTRDDRYEIVGIRDIPDGIIPGTMAFVIIRETPYLLLVGGVESAIALVRMNYTDTGPQFGTVQFGRSSGQSSDDEPSMSAFAGIVVASNQRDIYIWNRFSQERSGHIAHFTITDDTDPPRIVFAENTPTAGIQPRWVSLSSDTNQEFALVANDLGSTGIAAFRRDPATGRLDPNPAATLPTHLLATWGLPETVIKGPQVVFEI